MSGDFGMAILILDRLLVHHPRMEISVSDAKAQLTDLVRRAEAGDDIVLTRHGYPGVRLVPVKTIPDLATRNALLDALRNAGAQARETGLSASRSQDSSIGMRAYKNDGRRYLDTGAIALDQLTRKAVERH